MFRIHAFSAHKFKYLAVTRVRILPPQSRLNYATSTDSNSNGGLVAAHLLPRTFDIGRLRDNLARCNAKFTLRDKFIHVESCPELKHTCGSAIFTHNGVAVLWGPANSSLDAYRSLAAQGGEETDPTCSFSETLKFSETPGQTRVSEGSVLLTSSDSRGSDELAISMALETAVRLNYLEWDIKRNLELRNNSVFELQGLVKSHNLDRAARTLFELETYAHDCRYRLNLQQDLLEYPDFLWDLDRQCDLFSRVQSTFELPKRLEHLNHRISWTLETLNSYSEFVRHQHSSRLEKVIIAVISVELLLALVQAVRTSRAQGASSNLAH